MIAPLLIPLRSRYEDEGQIPRLIPLPHRGRGQGEGESRRRACVRRESYHGTREPKWTPGPESIPVSLAGRFCQVARKSLPFSLVSSSKCVPAPPSPVFLGAVLAAGRHSALTGIPLARYEGRGAPDPVAVFPPPRLASPHAPDSPARGPSRRQIDGGAARYRCRSCRVHLAGARLCDLTLRQPPSLRMA